MFMHKITFIPLDDLFTPDIFMGNWALHNSMHGILANENFWATFLCMEISFSCMEISFSCMKLKFSCMKYSLGDMDVYFITEDEYIFLYTIQFLVMSY